MSTIFLQLEGALADARATQERAAEKLHDTGVANALAKSEYELASEAVRRVEGALNALHGVAAAPSAPVAAPPAEKPRRKEPRQEGPPCPSCGEVGKLSRVMIGSLPFVRCGACMAEIAQ